jgi:hypothetical protein
MIQFFALSALVGSVAVGLAVGIASSLRQQAQLTRASLMTLETQSVVESVRAEILAAMRQSGQNGVQIRADMRTAMTNPAAASPIGRYLATEHRPVGLPATSTALVRLRDVTPADPPREAHSAVLRVRWQDQPGAPRKKDVNLRIRLGQNTVFSNAATGNTFQCTFCHVHIYGNVAEYSNHVGDYRFDKRIHGRWVARGRNHFGGTVDNFGSKLEMVDGPLSGVNRFKLPVFAQMAGPGVPPASLVPDYWGLTHLNKDPVLNLGNTYVRGFETDAQGAAVPFNFQRQEHMLPKLDPETMMYLATGSLTGGRMQWYPYGRVPSQSPPGVSVLRPLPGGINGILEGNVVLNGRDAGPLRINGRVFVRGDVVIFGEVQGQGEIYAGRNIFIADDLTYRNPPQLFDGSEESNGRMAFAYQTPTARTLATEMDAAGNDRLALFATNNIVIGDPYPESIGIDPAAGTPYWNLSQPNAIYVSRAVLDLHYVNEVAFDRLNGYQLDSAVNPNGGRSFLYPWAESGSFLRPDAIREEPVRRFAGAGDAPNDKEWLVDSHHFNLSPAFMAMFLPKNMDPVTGNWVDWITSWKFLELTGNGAEWNYLQGDPPYLPGQMYVNPKANRYRRAYRYASLPLFKQFPFDPSKWRAGGLAPFPPTSANGVPSCHECENPMETEGATDTLDRHTGILSEAASVPNPIADGTMTLVPRPVPPAIWTAAALDAAFRQEYPASQYEHDAAYGANYATRTVAGFPPFPAYRKGPNLQESIRYFFQLCINAARGNGTQGFPGVNATGLTRTGRYASGVRYVPVPMRINGQTTNLSGQSLGNVGVLTCRFAYAREPGPNATTNPPINYRPGPTADIYYSNAPTDVNNPPPPTTTAACSDHGAPWFGGAMLSATAYQHAPPCFKWRFTPGVASSVTDARTLLQADLSIVLQFELPLRPEAVPALNVAVYTRYWDPGRMRPRNIIRRIQAFLFANQLIAYPSDGLVDTQLKIDGGMVARDFAGRLASATGSMTPYHVSNPLNPSLMRTNSYVHGTALVECANPAWQNSCPPYYPTRAVEGGQLPALILMLDPRAQFRTELMYRDFGMLELVQ